jgi:hypothetical protein
MNLSHLDELVNVLDAEKILLKRTELEEFIESQRTGADLDRIADEAVKEVLR